MRKSSLAIICLSTIVLAGFQVFGQYGRAYTVEAVVDIKPDTLNVGMQGRWITVYIRLPEGFNATDINATTIFLEHLFQVERSEIQGKALMVKFDASGVTNHLQIMLSHLGVHRTSVNLLVTGKLRDGTDFAGTDEITILFPKMSTNS